jgi:hypothetical protein
MCNSLEVIGQNFFGFAVILGVILWGIAEVVKAFRNKAE